MMQHSPWQTKLIMSAVERKLENGLWYFKLHESLGAQRRARLPFVHRRIHPDSIRIHPERSSDLKSDLLRRAASQ